MRGQALHILLWKRIIQALRERNALIEGTPGEIAAHAHDVLGNDIVECFLNDYYFERQFGGLSEKITDVEAERLVRQLESLPLPTNMATDERSTPADASALQQPTSGLPQVETSPSDSRTRIPQDNSREKSEVWAFMRTDEKTRERNEREGRERERAKQRKAQLWALADIIGAYAGAQALCRFMPYAPQCASGSGFVFYSALFIGLICASVAQKIRFHSLSPLVSLIFAYLGGALILLFWRG